MRKLKKQLRLLPSYVIVILVCLAIVVPILILVFASFKSIQEFTHSWVFAMPKEFTFQNYKMVFERGNFGVALFNTVLLLVLSIIVNIVLGSTMGYALGAFRFRFRKLIIALILGARVIPTITTQVAIFTIIKGLGLYDTIGAPVLLYAGADAVQVILFIRFVESIPTSVLESARIDGASHFKIFTSIVFPLLKPATITCIILKVVTVYNDMYIPYLYMPSSDHAVISTAIMKFCGSNYGAQIPLMSAAFMVAMLPMLLFYIISQKWLFDGITSGAVKE